MTCPLCGSKGWEGLFRFECERQGCVNHPTQSLGTGRYYVKTSHPVYGNLLFRCEAGLVPQLKQVMYNSADEPSTLVADVKKALPNSPSFIVRSFCMCENDDQALRLWYDGTF